MKTHEDAQSIRVVLWGALLGLGVVGLREGWSSALVGNHFFWLPLLYGALALLLELEDWVREEMGLSLRHIPRAVLSRRS